MLTARTDTVDVVVGLESGADDYVVKPFKPQELIARVRARLRRGDEPAPERLSIGDLEIDVAGHSVKRDGESLSLTPLEFDLLVALARKPWQVFTREVLLEQVWGYRHAGDTRLVNVHVQRLRSKIEHDPERPEIVVTVRGVGYKAGPVLTMTERAARSGPAGLASRVGSGAARRVAPASLHLWRRLARLPRRRRDDAARHPRAHRRRHLPLRLDRAGPRRQPAAHRVRGQPARRRPTRRASSTRPTRPTRRPS